MIVDEKSLEISNLLIKWYKKNKRNLPWRESSDPYVIWVSEIILQQTRVAQGLDYFLRFVNRFPDVLSLARADEDEVLKYWQGLGYYSRARNLHFAAKTICDLYGGVFPSSYHEVLSLKGVGEYTAAAIVSFAWNQPYSVVDGNVYRVLSRLYALETPIDTTQGKKQFAELAAMILDVQQPGLHNQAIMELGALQCIPQNPDCLQCPVAVKCMAFATNRVMSFPVKSKKTKTRNRYFHYFYIIYNGQTWLHRRSGKDIWEGLYEFPLIETESAMDFTDISETEEFKRLFSDVGHVQLSVGLANVKHVLSHQVLYATFYKVEIEQPGQALAEYIPVKLDALGDYAVPRLVHLFLERL